MVNGADTAETDSDTEAVQEVAQQAMGSGGENFVGNGGAMGEPSVVSNDSGGRHGDDYSLVQVQDLAAPAPDAVPLLRTAKAFERCRGSPEPLQPLRVEYDAGHNTLYPVEGHQSRCSHCEWSMMRGVTLLHATASHNTLSRISASSEVRVPGSPEEF